MVVTITSRVFNQDAAGAKRAASQGPVFITDRGRPAHVLLSIEDYRRLLGQERSIADLLALPAGEDLKLPLIQPSELARAADFS
jgi:prevent-host-death family protein